MIIFWNSCRDFIPLWPVGILGFVLIPLFMEQGIAQDNSLQNYPDRIVLQTKSGAKRTLQCRILDFNAVSISIKNKQTGKTEQYPADWVLEKHILQSTAQQSADQALQERDYKKAESLLKRAFDSENRSWVRQAILENQVRVALATAQYEIAGTRFLKLLETESQTRHFDLIPLDWSGKPSAPTSAVKWLESSNEVAQLMGVSWLLKDPQYKKRAGTVLKRLARSSNERIRTLAVAQRWRTYINSGEFSKGEIARWETQTEQLPGPLRAGPYFLLGQAYSQSLEHDRASARWLWLKANDHPDHELTASAQVQAANAVSKLGLKKQAQNLYREVLLDYPHTMTANKIQQRQPPAKVVTP